MKYLLSIFILLGSIGYGLYKYTDNNAQTAKNEVVSADVEFSYTNAARLSALEKQAKSDPRFLKKLAEAYFDGVIVEQNNSQGLSLLLKAVGKEDASSMLILAEKYRTGILHDDKPNPYRKWVLEPSQDTAEQLTKEAIEIAKDKAQTDFESSMTLAMSFVMGRYGITPDPVKGMKYLEQSYRLGELGLKDNDKAVLIPYAKLLFQTTPYQEAEPEKALEIYKLLIEAGDVEAMYSLGKAFSSSYCCGPLLNYASENQTEVNQKYGTELLSELAQKDHVSASMLFAKEIQQNCEQYEDCYSLSVEVLLNVSEQKPKSSYFWEDLAEAYANSGDLPKSFDAYLSAIDTFPHGNYYRQADAIRFLSIVAQGSRPISIRDLEEKLYTYILKTPSTKEKIHNTFIEIRENLRAIDNNLGAELGRKHNEIKGSLSRIDEYFANI